MQQWQQWIETDARTASLTVAIILKQFSVFRPTIERVLKLQIKPIIRPPDTVCRRTIFYRNSSSFFRRLISELAERNSAKIDHMLGSNYDLKTHVQYLGYPFPYKSGPKTNFFGRLRNFTANLTVYIFGMKHNIDNRSRALTTTSGLLHHPKISWTLVHKRLKIWPAFSPIVRKFCILLHCQASQTEISKRNSITLCQTVDGRLG